jgi:hypothetical protein
VPAFSDGCLREDQVVGEGSDLCADHLFESNWAIVRDLIEATAQGDLRERARAIQRLEEEVPADWRAGAIVGYLLWLHVGYLCGRHVWVNSERLDELAQTACPRFESIVNGDYGVLRDVLETVFGYVAPGHEVTGARLILYGSAALGALLPEDSTASLAEMRPLLVNWYVKYRADFEAANRPG